MVGEDKTLEPIGEVKAGRFPELLVNSSAFTLMSGLVGSRRIRKLASSAPVFRTHLCSQPAHWVTVARVSFTHYEGTEHASWARRTPSTMQSAWRIVRFRKLNCRASRDRTRNLRWNRGKRRYSTR